MLGLLLAMAHAAPPAGAPETPAAVTKLVPQLGHHGFVEVATFLPEGRRVLTAATDGAALWDAETGALVHWFGDQGGWATAAYAPDGQRIATASEGRLVLWDALTGVRQHVIETTPREIARHVAYGPDGRRIATDGAVWRADDGARLATLDTGGAEVLGLAFAPDSSQVLVVVVDQPPWVFDAQTGDVRLRLAVDDAVQATFSPDGRRIGVAQSDGHAAVFDAADGRLLWRKRVHRLWVHEVAFSPDGAQLVTVSDDGTAAMWQARNGKKRFRVRADDRFVFDASFSADGRWVATAGSTGAMVIDARSGRVQTTFRGHSDLVKTISFSPTGDHVVTGSWDDSALIWDARTGALVERLSGHAEPVLAVARPDPDRLLTLSDRGGLVAWDLRRGQVSGRTQVTLSLNPVFAISPDQHWLASAIDGHRAEVWDLRRGGRAGELGGHEAAILSLAFAPDGVRVASGRLDGTAVVHDAATGAILATCAGHGGPVTSTAFSPDSARLVTASEDGTAGVYDAASGRRLLTLEGHQDRLTLAAWRPDGRQLVTASVDNTVLIHDAASGAPVLALTGYERPVDVVAFSPDGTRLATASMRYTPPYGSLSVWDLSTGALRYDLPHRSAVDVVAFSADGSLLLTASVNGAFLWDARTGKRLQDWSFGWMVTSLAFVDGDRHVLATSRDGTTRLLDVAHGGTAATWMSLPDGQWAVASDSGAFDASGDGDVDVLEWVIDGEPYALGQLRAQFYDPGLLAKVMGRSSEPRRPVPELRSIRPPAKVHLDGPGADGSMGLRLEDRGGGVGTLFVRLNGSDVSSTVRQRCPDAEVGCRLSLADLPTWLPGANNQVDVEVGNAGDTVSSRGLDAMVHAGGAVLSDPPDLWVLAVGSSDYVGDQLDLKYAGSDAVRLATGLRVAGDRGFEAAHTHVRVLSTDAGSAVDGVPSREALQSAFDWLGQSDPLDTVVVFLSGHGVAYADPAGAVDDYFYLLPSAASWSDVRDAGLRGLRTWSGTDLSDALAAVPALKRVVILDTCAAGRFDPTGGSGARALSSDAVRAHARARERTGAWMLAGAAADQASFEASRYGQGVLTWTLLEGMRGPALDSGGALRVSRWFDHAENEVSVNAQGIGGIQVPVLRRGAGDFPIGEVRPEDRDRIPLNAMLPAVVRASIQGFGGRQDPVDLADALNRALRDEAAAPNARFAVWDGELGPGTWQLTGQVELRAGGLHYEGFATWRGEDRQEYALKADAPTADALAHTIIAAFVALLR